MSIAEVLGEIRDKLGLSRPELSKLLGLKHPGNVWLYESTGKNKRFPSIPTCMKIIDLAKEHCGKKVTIDMLRDDIKKG